MNQQFNLQLQRQTELLDLVSLQVLCKDNYIPEFLTLVLTHPQHGEVGKLEYWTRPDGMIQVRLLHVEPEWRRQGLASLMMRRLEQMYPEVTIDHGKRTKEGLAWAEAFYGLPDQQCRFTRAGQPVAT